MSRYILSIDQGTTSSRAIIFDASGAIISSAQKEFKQYYPNNGWVEHDPEEIWQTTIETCRQAMAEKQLSAADIATIGITNQRETTLVWDKQTGEPVYNAIVWQDRRTADYCSTLIEQDLEQEFNDKTGLLIDPYFSGTKLKWILDNVSGARARADKGELAFGTIDTFLLWRLTGGKSHKTDATNASRTLMFNIHSQEWDTGLLDRLTIPESLLPQVHDSSAAFGVTEAGLLGSEIAIGGMAGDQQAALVGQACFKEGMVKSTYGTGCFMMLNTGEQALKSNNRLLTTVAYRLNGKVTYAIEGSIFVAGAAIQWLRDGINLIQEASETEQLAENTPVNHGVYMVPAFTGLGAPYWDPQARGAISGLTRDTGIAEFVSAGLQSVCYQTKDLKRAMEDDGAIRPSTLRVDGGMVANNWLVQFLSDILGADIDRPVIQETTALGAAYLAGLQVGLFDSLEQIGELWQCQRQFTPQMPKTERDELYQGWEDAVSRVRSK
ncbi:glycerol kinase GlpK [Thalassomonas actiniarum]|uniref:Glycerol kinase n=1 Tax=Thalassomonas actiniarum TaxID=485447 RepID=A0AAF0C358_9GAMM|nr:glycerol kinase GlpK [Thalassomonas actiniarum]WDD98590.1 glycerol kinase GlpK [Thalassomonas actiniarum]